MISKNFFAPKDDELIPNKAFDRKDYPLINKTYCGHSSMSDNPIYLIDELSAFGEKRLIKLPSYNGKRFEFCYRCLEMMSRKCPITNDTIFVGDLIAVRYIQGNYKELRELFEQKQFAAYKFLNPNFHPGFSKLIFEAEEKGETIFEVVVSGSQVHSSNYYSQGIYVPPGVFAADSRAFGPKLLTANEIRNQQFLKL